MFLVMFGCAAAQTKKAGSCFISVRGGGLFAAPSVYRTKYTGPQGLH